MQVLAGDIGGTKTLLALCEVGASAGPPGAPRIEVLARQRYDSRKYPGLATICRAFAAEQARPLPAHAAFGVAGPGGNCPRPTTHPPLGPHQRGAAPSPA